MDHMEDLKLFYRLCNKRKDLNSSVPHSLFKSTKICNLVVHGCLHSMQATRLTIMQLLVALVTLHRRDWLGSQVGVMRGCNLTYDIVCNIAGLKIPNVRVKAACETGTNAALMALNKERKAEAVRRIHKYEVSSASKSYIVVCAHFDAEFPSSSLACAVVVSFQSNLVLWYRKGSMDEWSSAMRPIRPNYHMMTRLTVMVAKKMINTRRMAAVAQHALLEMWATSGLRPWPVFAIGEILVLIGS
jgi:hypothetical protein